ncbi:MAG TPA: NADH-quinone oxidoreductase subunit NuoH [Actinomycetota bacterium]|nr:NADH-quinone oxidoreductase subunit NuoH [Actinomycetota bacterium]
MTGAIDWVAWILLIARVIVIFALMLISVLLLIWIERKVIADMQVRIGPNRAGPAGVFITLADGIKLFFKEGITPVTADRPVFLLAPVASMVPAMLGFAVIPFGPGVELFGRRVPFQISDLNVGILWILAMASLAVYGVVLAGWASGSNYPLLGSIRSSAQMISYEVGMGLALVAVLLYSGSLRMSDIVEVQARHFGVPGLGWLPKWNLFLQFPAFLIYMIAATAETNRPPFDLPEAETELVAGYHTEYSGIKFAMFFLAEYMHTITVSAVGVTLFLGGWRGPMFGVVPWLWPVLWFLVKLFVVIYVLVWIRATIPRFRYDRLMSFGWKVMIPIGLLWILITAASVVLPNIYSDGRAALIIASGTIAVLLLVTPLFTSPPRSAMEGEDETLGRRGVRT